MRKIIGPLIAALLIAGGGAAELALATAASASVPNAVCNIGGYSDRGCMNRQGGGTAFGTNIIDYTPDFDNNEGFVLSQNLQNCDGYVHNGENGLVCPFWIGSNLNATYDGRPIVKSYATNVGGCVSFQEYPGLGNLQNCSDVGTDQVISASNYLINIYNTNQFHQPNQRLFVCGSNGGGQLLVALNGVAGQCQWTNQQP